MLHFCFPLTCLNIKEGTKNGQSCTLYVYLSFDFFLIFIQPFQLFLFLFSYNKKKEVKTILSVIYMTNNNLIDHFLTLFYFFLFHSQLQN